MRATSMATLPAPITMALSVSRSTSRSAKSGCALYQDTKSAEEKQFFRFSPGILSCLPFDAPVARTTAS